MASGNDGLHELESGLIHTADSLAGGVRGTFNMQFGEPGSPTETGSVTRESGILGKQPKLSTRFLERKGK